jgi:hypothetical protein
MLWYQVTRSTLSENCIKYFFTEYINSAFQSHTLTTCKFYLLSCLKTNARGGRSYQYSVYMCVSRCMHMFATSFHEHDVNITPLKTTPVPPFLFLKPEITTWLIGRLEIWKHHYYLLYSRKMTYSTRSRKEHNFC